MSRKNAWAALVAVLALTGFAQMPIMKRYHIADLPSLGWLADYSATSAVHYAAAALFLLLAGWTFTTWLAGPRRATPGLYLRAGAYLIVIATGLAHVAHNTTWGALPPVAAQTVVLAHLGGIMALFVLTMARLALRRRIRRD